MRRVFVAALALFAFAADAAAEIDPINWCPAGLSVPVAQPSEELEQAFRIVRTTLASDGAFYPTAHVASLELQPLAPRAVVSPRPELGLRGRALATPTWVMSGGADILNAARPAYCAITGPPSRRFSPAVCLSDIDANTPVARTAFYARIGEPFPRRPLMWGRSDWNRRRLGRNQDWAVLGEEGGAPPAFTRTLALGAISILRTPAVPAWNRRAFNAISVQFVLEGYDPFVRALNAPIRIEDGWLAITDVSTSGEVAIQRMTDEQWRAFQRDRCAAAG